MVSLYEVQRNVEPFGLIGKVAFVRTLPTASLGRTTTRPTAIEISTVVKPELSVQYALASPYTPRPAVNRAPVIIFFSFADSLSHYHALLLILQLVTHIVLNRTTLIAFITPFYIEAILSLWVRK